MANNKILVVDDDEIVLKTVQGILEHYSWNVLTAERSAKALSICMDENPFLLITDLRLHDIMDGATLAGRCKRYDPFVICIAMTGYLNAFDFGFLLASIFTDILTKPIDADLLVQVVEYAADKYSRWQKLLM